ncbi:MAG: adenosine deaminase [Planctomycetota bacterium]|nr:MAG: adenosine deaminase [Planctomycetota bacterium]
MITQWFGTRRKNKVELHLHLDGAVRVETFLDVARRRGIELPTRTPEGLARYVRVAHDCRSLTQFLATFDFFIPIIQDGEAIERIAYELCEDQARVGVRYFEARFSPQLLARDGLAVEEVVERVLVGLERGQRAFEVGARAILCCMRHRPDWSMEVVRLAVRYREHGVVGIDLAGDESRFGAELHAEAYRAAREMGLHRTVHAGEAGPAHNIREALDLLGAERIGHGYRLVDDEELYARVREEDIPLECCLTSSLQTGSVPDLATHPVRRFVLDGLNVSLSTDDPSVSGIDLEHEYRLALSDLGFGLADLTRMVFNAARSSFLPPAEQRRLIAELKREYLPPDVL